MEDPGMRSRAPKLYQALPGKPGEPEEQAEFPLAQALIDRCLQADVETGMAAIRASCLAVRMARRLLWPAEMLDLAHLACLGRQDRDENRDRWSTSAHPVLRLVVRESEDNPSLLDLVRLALLAERLVREEGVFHGVETLMRQKAPEPFLDAAWDLRYDEATWLRMEHNPAQEALLHAGRLGLSPLPLQDRISIPIPLLALRKSA